MKIKLFNDKLHFIVTSLVVVFVVSLTIGFSAFNTELSISGIVSEVRPISDVRITGLTLVESSGNAVVRSSEYSEDKLFFDVSFPDDTSYVLYDVELTVFGSQSVALDYFSIASGQSAEWQIIDMNFHDTICNSYGQCTLGAKKTFRLKLYDYFYDSASDYNFSLQTNFINSYAITYVGDSGDYPKYVLHGYGLYANCSQNFNVVDVYMGGALLDPSMYSYNDGMLNISEVTGDVTVVFYEIIYGDINGDGSVGTVDRVLLSRYVNGTYELTDKASKAADVNGDGDINSVDVDLLGLIVLGQYDAPGSTPLIEYIHYGDINEDNQVDSVDAVALSAYLTGKTSLNEKALLNADINGDEFVNKLDLQLINAVIKNEITHSVVIVLVDYPHYGDVDMDNEAVYADYELIEQHIETGNELSGDQLEWADINDDGNINDVDLVLLMRVLNCFEGYEDFSILYPITDYVLYGDVHPDGVINSADLAELKLILAGSTIPTDQQKKNADVNGDGSIDSVDQVALNRALAGFENYLPDYPYSE